MTMPWPKVGETWAPCLPWPTEECPRNMHIRRLEAERCGFWVIEGVSLMATRTAGATAVACSEAGATALAWEFRYGEATMLPPAAESPVAPAASVLARMSRYGSGSAVIVEVGSNTIWGRGDDGRIRTFFARDVRVGWTRIA